MIMRLGELLRVCKGIDDAADVIFEWQQFGVGGICTYRGESTHLSLLYCTTGQGWSVGRLRQELEDLIGGKILMAYKGGEAHFNAMTPLWIGNWGTCTGTAVTGFEIVGHCCDGCHQILLLRNGWVDWGCVVYDEPVNGLGGLGHCIGGSVEDFDALKEPLP